MTTGDISQNSSHPLYEFLSAVLRDLTEFEGPITDDLGPESVPGWDSVTHIEIIEELESHFGVHFTTEKLIEMTSIGAIRVALEHHGVIASDPTSKKD